ncbi:helix-turn-helix transcriptional regulator [Streptomyces sp. L2]|uniref:helix-turn-helix domain-containing protein n=1 Tax=Streptomyces sp. L2 TaxID=2162665 RepID=UPI0010120BC3|nr:helix-turn-helix transcriptional regulator [Streptomyces sp. L2]
MKPTGKEVDPKDRAFGRHVKRLRKERGLTQQRLAAALHRTSSWMSQVERGVQPIERIDVLQQLAAALGVSVRQLRPGAPLPASVTRAETDREASDDLEGLRRLLSGHPAASTVFEVTTSGHSRSLSQLATEVDNVETLTLGGQLAPVSGLLTRLLPDLEQLVRVVEADDRDSAYLLLARAYQALAATLVRQDEADAAWVAADRAVWAAEKSSDPLHVCVGVLRMVEAFVRVERLGQAEHAAQTAIDALIVLDQKNELPLRGISVLGSLHLALARAYARCPQRSKAHEHITRARTLADRVGWERNDFNLAFGPASVTIQAVSVALDLGDAGEALDLGGKVDVTSLPPEQQGRLLMYLGRAHAQRRHTEEALSCMLRADELVPEMMRRDVGAREAIRELVLINGPGAPPDLMALATRVDALP